MTRTAHFLVAIALLMPLAVALQVWRDRGWQAYEPATPVMWLQAGPAIKRLGARVRQPARRSLLDSRRGVFRAAAAVDCGR